MTHRTIGAESSSTLVVGQQRASALFGLIAMFVTMVVVSLLAIALTPILWGWKPVAVTSSSMAPAIDVGDVVVNLPSNGRDLSPGTVITFGEPGSVVTHRIVEVLDDGRYRTRGDASVSVDSSPVRPDQITGVGRILVPYVGYPYAAWAVGDRSTAVLLGAGLILMGYASNLAYPKDGGR